MQSQLQLGLPSPGAQIQLPSLAMYLITLAKAKILVGTSFPDTQAHVMPAPLVLSLTYTVIFL